MNHTSQSKREGAKQAAVSAGSRRRRWASRWGWGFAAVLAASAAGCQGEPDDPSLGAQQDPQSGRYGGSIGEDPISWGECAPPGSAQGGSGEGQVVTDAELRELCAPYVGDAAMRPVTYEPWRVPAQPAWRDTTVTPVRGEAQPTARAPRRSTRTVARAPARQVDPVDVSDSVDPGEPEPRIPATPPREGEMTGTVNTPGTLLVDGRPMAEGERVVLVLPEGDAVVRDTPEGIRVTIRPDRPEDAAALRTRLERWVEANRVGADVQATSVAGERTTETEPRVDGPWRPSPVESSPMGRPAGTASTSTGGTRDVREISWPATRDDDDTWPPPQTTVRPAVHTGTGTATRTIEWTEGAADDCNCPGPGLSSPDPDGDGKPVPLFPQTERIMVPPVLPDHLRR